MFSSHWFKRKETPEPVVLIKKRQVFQVTVDTGETIIDGEDAQLVHEYLGRHNGKPYSYPAARTTGEVVGMIMQYGFSWNEGGKTHHVPAREIKYVTVTEIKEPTS